MRDTAIIIASAIMFLPVVQTKTFAQSAECPSPVSTLKNEFLRLQKSSNPTTKQECNDAANKKIEILAQLKKEAEKFPACYEEATDADIESMRQVISRIHCDDLPEKNLEASKNGKFKDTLSDQGWDRVARGDFNYSSAKSCIDVKQDRSEKAGYIIKNKCSSPVKAVVRTINFSPKEPELEIVELGGGSGLNEQLTYSYFGQRPEPIRACFTGQPGCTYDELKMEFGPK